MILQQILGCIYEIQLARDPRIEPRAWQRQLWEMDQLAELHRLMEVAREGDGA